MQYFDIIEVLYQNFLWILLVLMIVVASLTIFFIKVASSKIGNRVMVFDENTITEFKAKRYDDLVKFAGKSVAKKYTPRLKKYGLFTNRVYILEEGQRETTDIYATVKNLKEGKELEQSIGDSSKQQILESGIVDRFLAVFKRIGFSWETFLFGLMTGLVIMFLVATGGYI